jgi:hypothetical protein
MSRRLVVDASVARSAGTAENPTSQYCRQFLAAMLAICHKVVMTDDIEKEWRNHGSRYSISWLTAMQSRRKLVRVPPSEEHNRVINAQLAAADLPEAQRAAIEKDLLLVVAALASDRIVASLDDRMRKLLGKLAPVSDAVGSLCRGSGSQVAGARSPDRTRPDDPSGRRATRSSGRTVRCSG